eukprot:TRINITY_DN10666_c0_g1_i1.p1 TRINITY_DN10666_c0_g1~~TRINITY_DN10666_c0_g1_i1.p1  ORF type:complete len:205 (+),score=-18.95 TRINITY_DN10666_c0_g1_i1:285-899(+)
MVQLKNFAPYKNRLLNCYNLQESHQTHQNQKRKIYKNTNTNVTTKKVLQLPYNYQTQRLVLKSTSVHTTYHLCVWKNPNTKMLLCVSLLVIVYIWHITMRQNTQNQLQQYIDIVVKFIHKILSQKRYKQQDEQTLSYQNPVQTPMLKNYLYFYITIYQRSYFLIKKIQIQHNSLPDNICRMILSVHHTQYTIWYIKNNILMHVS